MAKHTEQWFDLSKHFHLIVLIFLGLIVLFIAYYFLYALPHFNQQKLDLEREKQEQEVREKEEKIRIEQEREEEQKSQLDNCLSLAQYKYSLNWDSACKIHKTVVDKAWKDCRSQIFSWQTDATNKEDCKRTAPDYNVDDTGSCLLPTSRSSQVEKSLKDDKEECYRKYPTSS